MTLICFSWLMSDLLTVLHTLSLFFLFFIIYCFACAHRRFFIILNSHHCYYSLYHYLLQFIFIFLVISFSSFYGRLQKGIQLCLSVCSQNNSKINLARISIFGRHVGLYEPIVCALVRSNVKFKSKAHKIIHPSNFSQLNLTKY